MSEKRLKILLPIAILVVGVAAMVAMFRSRSPAPTRPPRDFAPVVRVVEAQSEDRQLVVHTQGTVRPRTESALISEVAGRVVDVSPEFAIGGFFDKNDVLIRIDPRDYELAVVTARGAVAQARVRLETEEAQAKVAREEWSSLGSGGNSPLATRELQVQEARAALAAAEARLEQAERDLGRTRIRAPFVGRVREKFVDVGQFVSPGVPVGEVFAVDYVEIRLPIRDGDLAYLELPLHYRVERGEGAPRVRLHTEFAGARHEWMGRIVRVGGEIDPVSRMVHVIAQVDNPYQRGRETESMPLAVGMFVGAEILGREVRGVFALPRAALRHDSMVFVVDDEGRLRYREVEVLKETRDQIIVSAGLQSGDIVCISTLDAATDGMRVRTRKAGATLPDDGSERPDSVQAAGGGG